MQLSSFGFATLLIKPMRNFFPRRPRILTPIGRSTVLLPVVLISGLLISSSPVFSQQTVNVTLDAVRDNSLYSENNNSNGQGQYLFSGSTNNNFERRALLFFDLSAIPSDAVIQQATVQLNMNKTISGAVSCTLHRVTADWGEGTSNASGEEGQGTPPEPGDATWNHRFFSTTNWTTSGGDFVASASATTSVGSNGTYTWTSPTLIQDANNWVNGTNSNFGWILQAAGGAKRFASREFSNSNNRPKLILQYQTNTTPAPTNLDLTSASDTGSSNIDNVTMNNTPTFTGDSAAGTTVTIYADGVSVGSGAGGSNFSVTTSTIPDGVKSVTATATLLGIEGPASAPLSVTVDTVAPATPGPLNLIAGSDSGPNNSDNITSENTPTIDGPAESGKTVTLTSSIDSIIATATASGNSFSATPGTAISDGNHLITATVEDLAGNTSGASASLAVTIDTFPPAAPTALDLLAGSDSGNSNSDNLTNLQLVQISTSAESGSTVTFASNLDGNVGSGSSNGSATITSSALSEGNHTITAIAVDLAGNAGSNSSALPISVDLTDPTLVINQSAGQADPTPSSPILFTAVFSEPVTGFGNGDVSIGGSANPTTVQVAELSPNNGTTFSISISGMTAEGSVTASIPGNGANDLAGNGNAASTSTDNLVLFGTPPQVIINQKGGQLDPTTASPVLFQAVFSEPVVHFSTGDVFLGGTANASTAAVSEVAPNNGTTYDISVSGMATEGTVIASIAAGVAEDLNGNLNIASTSTDNSVVFGTPPTVTIEEAANQDDPAGDEPILFRALFSEPIVNFINNDVTIEGSANPDTVTVSEIAPNNGTTFTVSVSGMTQEGTVTASIDAGVAQDAAGFPNEASTSTDNTVIYDLFGSTAAEATLLEFSGSNAHANGHLEAGDVDFVKFTLLTTAQVRIRTTGPVDTVGSLFDSNDELLNEPNVNDDEGTGSNFQIEQVLASGTYSVKVESKGANESGDYTVDIDILVEVDLQPDLSIGKSPGSLRGLNVFNTTGTGQALTLTSKKLRRLNFHGRLENDGDAADEIIFTATRGISLFATKYFVNGANVTGAATTSGHRSSLEVDEGVALRILVKPSKRLKIRRTNKIKRKKRNYTLRARSFDATKLDVARAIAKTR